MLGGKGRSSGVVNEATSQYTNEQLTKAIDEMKTTEYMKSRDLADVIPTHKRKMEEKKDEEFKVHELKKKDGAETAEAEEGESDDDLAMLRQRRAAAMKKEMGKMSEWRLKQHGSYREISQDDFFQTVVREKGGSDHVAVHFFHKDFERCKIMDVRMQEAAQMMMPVKFVKADVEKCPFLVEKLKVRQLPCVVLFANDIAVDRIVGFEDFESGDEFGADQLVRRIAIGCQLVAAEE